MSISMNEIKYTECYVAYLDILGMKELVKSSQENPEKLKNLVMALNEIADTCPSACSKRDLKNNVETDWCLQVRFFSDSLVLFIPTAAESHISFIISKAGHLYDRMLEQGYCLRGVVTVGDMYWDDDWSKNGITPEKKDLNLPVTLGLGLNEAIELEEDVAVYPRILISNKLKWYLDEIKSHREDKGFKAFPISSGSVESSDLRVNDFIKQDFDGLFYFDLFSKNRYKSYVAENIKEMNAERIIPQRISHHDWLTSLKPFLEEKIKEFYNMERILAKYLWLANKFNAHLIDAKISDIKPIEIRGQIPGADKRAIAESGFHN